LLEQRLLLLLIGGQLRGQFVPCSVKGIPRGQDAGTRTANTFGALSARSHFQTRNSGGKTMVARKILREAEFYDLSGATKVVEGLTGGHRWMTSAEDEGHGKYKGKARDELD
jgi:hypothetical protein